MSDCKCVDSMTEVLGFFSRSDLTLCTLSAGHSGFLRLMGVFFLLESHHSEMLSFLSSRLQWPSEEYLWHH